MTTLIPVWVVEAVVAVLLVWIVAGYVLGRLIGHSAQDNEATRDTELDALRNQQQRDEKESTQ